MKLKFKILALSKLNLNELNQKILKILKDKQYIITDVKERTIVFKDDVFEFRSKTDINKKVDSGIFDINVLEDNCEIEYTYFVSLNGSLFLTVIVVFLSVVVIGNLYLLLIMLPIILQLLFRISSLKSVSKDLLSEIISDPVI